MILRFFKELNMLKKGLAVYRRLKHKYGKNTHIFVAQHEGLGDAYLTGLCIRNSGYAKGFIVTTFGEGSLEVYQYLGIMNVCLISRDETEALIRFSQLMADEKINVTILHHQAMLWHTGIAWNLQGYKKINFRDLIVGIVFPELRNRQFSFEFEQREQDGLEILEANGLKAGNTVILFPYANTLPMHSIVFWARTIEKIEEKGISVATYICGREKPLLKTVGVNCKISSLVDLVEKAGIVIGVRSGIIDIIAHAKCKKYIYYPIYGAESWIHGSIKDYWSLNEFGYCDDAEEMEFDNKGELRW